jgi:hypothetical protein
MNIYVIDCKKKASCSNIREDNLQTSYLSTCGKSVNRLLGVKH